MSTNRSRRDRPSKSLVGCYRLGSSEKQIKPDDMIPLHSRTAPSTARSRASSAPGFSAMQDNRISRGSGLKQGIKIERSRVHLEIALGVSWPELLRAVAVKFNTVAIRIAQI